MARPKGAKNKTTIERESLVRDLVLRQQAAGSETLVQPSAEDIAKMSPLDVMQYAMVLAAVGGEWNVAAELASRVAPYRHARLSNITSNVTLNVDPESMTDDQLASIIESGGGEGPTD